MLWSSHGDEQGLVQQFGGDWISYRHLDPRRVVPELRSVIFSACHLGRWEAYWHQAFGGAWVYGWGKPVGFARAEEFYDPTSTASVRLDKILERDFDLRTGAISEMHRAMHGDQGVGKIDPAAAALVTAAPHLRVGLNGGVALDAVTGRALVDCVRADGRHQRATARLIDPSPALEEYAGDTPLLCIESLVGPFPEDGFDAHDDVDVDEVLMHFTLRRTHFARVQIEGQPFETVLVQACLPSDVHPAVVALALDEVVATADTLEEQMFGGGRR